MNHITYERLQDFEDGILSITEKREIDSHLQLCGECRDMLDNLRAFESAVRRVSLERASGDFTLNVMKKLRIENSPSYVWTIFEHLAPLLAFTVIAGIVYALFQFTGTYKNSEMNQSVQLTQSIYDRLGDAITSGLTVINKWMEKYLSFAFAKNSYG